MQGLILTSTVREGIGHITQVCTSPETRHTGLGYELIRRARVFGGDVVTFSNRNISMVTGAINYKFGGPLAAKY